MRQLIKYPGSKWSLAKWIISFFPTHHSYLEPYFGSGAVLFNKKPSNIETINDLDDQVVNLFEIIKTYPEELAKEIAFTPYARTVFNKAFRRAGTEKIVKAAEFIIRCDMGQGFRTSGEKTGFKMDIQGREDSYAVKHWNALPELIAECAKRLKGVQIENRDAVSVIKRFKFPNVLIYADPPYVLSKRHGKQYACEADDDDHRKMLKALKNHPGPVILSGYENDIYRNLISDWHKEKHRYTDQTGKGRKEVLWMNFTPTSQMEIKL